MIFLESRQLAVVTQEGVQLQTLEGKKLSAKVHHVAWDPVSALL